jgi:acetyl-CoA carboxylase/biotin carboxylase 1
LDLIEYSNSRVGRMEAKGCAKPCVWGNARRHFYWALRARLAKTHAIAQIKAAAPSFPAAMHAQLLSGLIAHVDPSDSRAMAEALEGLNLTETLAQLRDTEVAKQMATLLQSNRKSVLDGIVRVANEALSDQERSALLAALQAGPVTGKLGP